MSALEPNFGDVWDRNGVYVGDNWCCIISGRRWEETGNYVVVASGFGRRKDAQIACEYLESLGIDFSAAVE